MNAASLTDALDQAFALLKTIDPPIGNDEGFGSAILRSPLGHPVRDFLYKTTRCAACGNLAPFIKTQFVVDDGFMSPDCKRCGSPEVHMYDEGEVGHA
jgi:hypothetical protein